MLCAAVGALSILASSLAEAGTLEGKVEVKSRRGSKVVKRYADTGAPESRELARVPTIVFIKGRVEGQSTGRLPQDYTIDQLDATFTPAFVVIPVGARVSFPNSDDEYHNAFSYSKTKRFDLGRYPKGESKTVTFDRPGVVKIYCEIHPWMRAAVMIVENPFFAIADETGAFRISDVPAGSYTLVAWNIDGGATESVVEVVDTGVAEVEMRLAGVLESDLEVEKLSMLAPVGDVARSSADACCQATFGEGRP